MSAVLLPIQPPMITGYVHHGHVLSILAHYPESSDWFYSNYIQLYCHRNFKDSSVPFNFFIYDELIYEADKQRYTTGLSHYLNSIPWLSAEKISRQRILQMGRDCVSFLKECIHAECYIFTYIDEFFIPHTPFYQKNRFAHQVLIFGYDDEAGTFQVADFIQDRNQTKYTQFDVPYEHMAQGFSQVELAGEHRQYTYLLRYRPHTVYPFDLQHACRQLSAYVNSGNSYHDMRNMQPPIELAFGMESYSCLENYLEQLRQDRIAFDVRPFHIMWEHKTCMQARLDHLITRLGLEDLRDVAAEYAQVEKGMRTVRLMLMMYQQNQDPALISKMIASLQDTAPLEQSLLERMLAVISSSDAQLKGGIR